MKITKRVYIFVKKRERVYILRRAGICLSYLLIFFLQKIKKIAYLCHETKWEFIAKACIPFDAHVIALTSSLTGEFFLNEFFSLPKRFRSFSNEKTVLPLRDWIHAAWVNLRWILFSIKTQQATTQLHFFFPSTSKNPKSANFWVKIFVPNHCKSSGSKFLRSSSIIEQVMYQQNSSFFPDFSATYVIFFQ